MDALSIALWLLAGLAGLLGLVVALVVMSGINRLDDAPLAAGPGNRPAQGEIPMIDPATDPARPFPGKPLDPTASEAMRRERNAREHLYLRWREVCRRCDGYAREGLTNRLYIAADTFDGWLGGFIDALGLAAPPWRESVIEEAGFLRSVWIYRQNVRLLQRADEEVRHARART